MTVPGLLGSKAARVQPLGASTPHQRLPCGVDHEGRGHAPSGRLAPGLPEAGDQVPQHRGEVRPRGDPVVGPEAHRGEQRHDADRHHDFQDRDAAMRGELRRSRGQSGVDVDGAARASSKRGTCHLHDLSSPGCLASGGLGRFGHPGSPPLARCAMPPSRSGPRVSAARAPGRRPQSDVDTPARSGHHRALLVEPPSLVAGLVFKTSGTARERRPGGSIPLLYRSAHSTGVPRNVSFDHSPVV